MEPSGLVLTWTQIIAAAIVFAMIAGALFGLKWWKNRQREARNERAPQREKVLRPAGYSALCRIDELAEKRSDALIGTLVAGVVLGLTFGGFYPIMEGLVRGRFTLGQVRAYSNSYLLLSLAAGFVFSTLTWAVWRFVQFWKLDNEIRNWRFGLRGEQAVAEKLMNREVVAAGYVTFHDVPGDKKWNIDHVVVGPGGVFVIETKARPRRKATREQQEQDVFFDGQVLQFPWCDDRKAVKQVGRNAKWMRDFIAGFGPKDVPVQPVIVLPGWYVKPQGIYPVKVMNACYLVNYLVDAKRVLTPEELQPILRRLDERCRTLEF